MSFLTLDLNLLRVFDAVMTEQNLTRAAGHLAMTQPAVSNAIKRLRESLGDELLIRTAYGVKPTPRAEALWPAVRQALAALEAAVMPETFDVSKAQATFRMAMADATAAYWLPSLMRSIEREAPGVNIRMVPLTTREPRPMLLRGDIDLAVGFFPGVAAQLSYETGSPIRHERLYSGKYVCVMRKDHPLAKEKLDLDTYCKANHLLVSFSGRAHGLVDEALAQLAQLARIVQRAVLEDAFARLEGQVQAVEGAVVLFQLVDHAQALQVVLEAAVVLHAFVEHVLADVAERRVAEVVGQRRGFDQVLVQAQAARQGAPDLGHFDRVRQARAEQVALVVQEDLGFVFQPAKGRGVDDAVAVARKGGAGAAGRLGKAAPARGVGAFGVGGERRLAQRVTHAM